MALSTVRAYLKDGKIAIVLRGANPDEVSGTQAREMAIKEAAKYGFPRVGYNNCSGPYPVDKDGQTTDDPKELIKWARERRIVAYQNDQYLMQGL